MSARVRILVIGDESAERLPLKPQTEPDQPPELSDANPLEITLAQIAGVTFEFFELTNDRRCRPYLQLYLDIIGTVDVVLYVCATGQSVKDMKEWLRLLPLGPLKLLFVSSESAYNNQAKLIDRLGSCFRREVVDSILFLPRMEGTVEEAILQVYRNQRRVVTLDDYARQANPMSMMRWLFRRKAEAVLPAPESPI